METPSLWFVLFGFGFGLGRLFGQVLHLFEQVIHRPETAGDEGREDLRDFAGEVAIDDLRRGIVDDFVERTE
jgi:hypothetical protein